MEGESDHHSPAAAQYIHTVQHLIEECIIFKLSKEESMEALSKYANILPAITSTVWNELEKENKEFFQAYNRGGGGGGEEEKAVTEVAGGSTMRLDTSRSHA